MSRLNITSIGQCAVAATLVLTLLARVPLGDGLLLHDHNDLGMHSHAVTLDDLHEHELQAASHHHYDDIHDGISDDENYDSTGHEYADSFFIFVIDPALAPLINGSSGDLIASILQLCSNEWPGTMMPGDPTDPSRFLAAAWPSAPPVRLSSALDALLQTSRALLL